MKTIYSLFLCGILSFMVSCKDLNETYGDYIKGGEIVYRAKPVNIEARLGNMRARIDWSLLFPTLIEKCLIYSDGELLAEVPVEYADSVRLSCMLENLEERTYILNMYSEDGQGNRSIKVETFVNVYGPRYISSLRTNRNIQDALRYVNEPDNLKIILSAGTSETLASEIVYEDINGNKQNVRVAPDIDTVILNNVPIQGEIQVQDLSQPDSTCIDTFVAPALTFKIENLPSGSNRNAEAIRDDVTGNIRLTFANAKSSVLYTEVTYTNKNNAPQTVLVAPETRVIILENSPLEGDISIRTYLKDAQGQAEFVTPYSIINAAKIREISKAWAIYEISAYEYNDGAPELLFDGVISSGSMWHTPYDGNAYIKPGETNTYPHWVIVDMGGNRTISSFKVARRSTNDNFAKRIRFEVSENGADWSGEEFETQNVDGFQTFTLTTSIQGRYFKFTGLESWTTKTFMCVSEIAVN